MTRFLLVVLFWLPFVATAEQPKTADSCERILAGSDEALYRFIFGNYVRHYEDGLGVRGYMGGAVPNTPYTLELALEYGLIWWGMKWHMVSSLEEAVAHRLRVREYYMTKKSPFTDVIVAGQYILGSEEEIGIFAEGQTNMPIPPEKMRELISRGAYEIDETGKSTFIPPEQLARRVSLDSTTFNKMDHLPASGGKNSISQSGWVAFKMHGLHDYSTWKNSDAAKRLRKSARQLMDRGYTLRFNVDYEAMLNKIRDQVRSYRVEDAKVDENGNKIEGKRENHLPDSNRYTKDNVYRSALGLLKAGRGYSVGLYNEKNELVAGEIGFRSGNHFYGDSVFYDDIDHARICALALFEVLDAAGMPYSDPGMITVYTASMGAELVPFPEYMAKIKSGPEELISLPQNWDVRSDEDIKRTFAEIANKKSQGLGPHRLIRRTPVAVPHLGEKIEEAAKRAGLSPVKLNLVFVESAQAAAQDVAHRTWEELPIYIEVAELTIDKSKTSLLFLSDILKRPGVKAYYLGSPRHPESRREIGLKQLTDVLELKTEANPPEWIVDQPLPTLEIKGWGMPSSKK